MYQVKVENQSVFQDIASLTAVANSYSTTELLVESQCDIYVQKIGSNYAAFTWANKYLLIAGDAVVTLTD